MVWHLDRVAWGLALCAGLGSGRLMAQAAPTPADTGPAPAAAHVASAAETAVIQQAIASLAAGRGADAVPLMEQLTREQPQSAQAWFLLGAALHMSGQIDRAIEVHARAATFPQVRPASLYNLGCAHALKGHVDEAFTILQAAKAVGFDDEAQLLNDADLQSLRSDPRFAGLLKPADLGKPFAEPLTVLHVWHGEAAGERFGWEAVDAGDVDGDGAHDVLASAPFHREAGAAPQVGRVSLHSGRSGALLWSRKGGRGDAAGRGEHLGAGISALGDVNGDGARDVLVGAPTPAAAPAAAAPDAAALARPGRAYVLSGKDGAVLLMLEGEVASDNFGDQVRGLGDIDGDELPDFAVSAPQHDGAGAGSEASGAADTANTAAATGSGRVYVYSGATGRRLFTLDGQRAGDRFGSALGGGATHSDADAGHAPLLMVGAMNAGEGQRGAVSVFRVEPEDGGLRPQLVVTLAPEATGQNFGQFCLSLVGDVDADAVADIYSSDFADRGKPGPGGGAGGRAYLHSGRDFARLAVLPARAAGEGFGIGNAQAGDVNHDGCADLVIGAWTNSERAPRAGKAYVISGRDRTTLATFTGVIAGDEFGFDATGLGDVDGDGAIDFLITAASSNDGAPQAGRVYVISGATVPGVVEPAARDAPSGR